MEMSFMAAPQLHPATKRKPRQRFLLRAFPDSFVNALTILMWASLAASITLMISPNGADLSAAMASFESGLVCASEKQLGFQLIGCHRAGFGAHAQIAFIVDGNDQRRRFVRASFVGLAMFPARRAAA
jgi:hypothetical protein